MSPRFYRRPEVEARTGLKKSEVYRRSAAGTFPRPLKLGRRYTAWVADEVDNWIAAEIRRGRGDTPAPHPAVTDDDAIHHAERAP
jgi:prophage regulatory protein